MSADKQRGDGAFRTRRCINLVYVHVYRCCWSASRRPHTNTQRPTPKYLHKEKNIRQERLRPDIHMVLCSMAELHVHRISLLMRFKRHRGSIKTSSSGRRLLIKWDLKSRGRALVEGPEFPLVCVCMHMWMSIYVVPFHWGGCVCYMQRKAGRKQHQYFHILL